MSVTSGSFNTTGYNGRYLVFSWTASQSTNTNKSTISWTLKGAGTAPAGYYTSGNFKVVIDGATVYSTSEDNRINLYNGTVVASGTKVLEHDSKGERSFSASVQAGIYYYAVNCSGSGSWTLKPIPRQSAISSVTSEVTVNGTNTVAVNITRYNSAFTHYVGITIGTYKYEVSGIGTSTSYAIPMSWLNAVPNAMSGTAKVQVTTFNGTTQVGTSVFAEFKIKVPTTVVPSIGGISWTKSSSEPSTWPMTQTVSKGTLSMTGVAGAYGSTIKSYSLTFVGLSSTASTLTVNNIAVSGTQSAVAKVIDSRGQSVTKTVNFSVSAYSKPKLSVEVYRSDASGNEDDSGDYLRVKPTVSITAVGDNAIQSITLQYKQHSASTYTSVALSSVVAKIVSASSNYTWDWIVTASDKVNPVSVNDSIGTGAVVLDILANGKGIAFGKVAEAEGLSSGWDTSAPNVTATGKIKGAYAEATNATFTNVTATNMTTTNLSVGGVAVATMLKNMKDYVVEQGTSGIWTYRKWNSGIAECWGTRTITGVKVDQAWEGLYYAATPDPVSYPFTFTATPNEVATMGSNNMSVWMANSSINTTASTGKYFVMRPTSASTTTYTVTIYYQVVGRWK